VTRYPENALSKYAIGRNTLSKNDISPLLVARRFQLPRDPLRPGLVGWMVADDEGGGNGGSGA
jgi:hypothetical protein